MFARGGGRRHYLDRPYNGATTDGAELEIYERSEHRHGRCLEVNAFPAFRPIFRVLQPD